MTERPNTGRAPYGLVWQDGKLVVVPEEAAVRKRMFELFLETPRKGAVAKQLNLEGHKTRGGGRWTDSAVKRNLECTSAKGIYAVNKTTTDADGKRVPRPESEWVLFECERMVSDEMWDEVQALAGDSPGAGSITRPQAIHAFSGIAFCACGGKMRVPSNSPKFVCPSCRRKIAIEDLEGVFVDELGAILSDREDLLAQFVADPGAGKRTLAIQKTRSVIERLEFELKNVLDLFHAKKLDMDQFGERHTPLEARLSSMRSTLKSLEGSGAQIIDTEAIDPAAFLRQWPEMSAKTRLGITKAVVERVVVDDGAIDFTYHFGEEPVDDGMAKKGGAATGAGSLAGATVPVREPGEPFYIRLPTPPARCPWTGLSRTKLNTLVLDCAENGYKAPVKSVPLPPEGKERGVRLIDWASLKAYLESLG